MRANALGAIALGIGMTSACSVDGGDAVHERSVNLTPLPGKADGATAVSLELPADDAVFFYVQCEEWFSCNIALGASPWVLSLPVEQQEAWRQEVLTSGGPIVHTVGVLEATYTSEDVTIRSPVVIVAEVDEGRPRLVTGPDMNEFDYASDDPDERIDFRLYNTSAFPLEFLLDAEWD